MGRDKKYGNLTIKDEGRDILEQMAKSQSAEYRKDMCSQMEKRG